MQLQLDSGQLPLRSQPSASAELPELAAGAHLKGQDEVVEFGPGPQEAGSFTRGGFSVPGHPHLHHAEAVIVRGNFQRRDLVHFWL